MKKAPVTILVVTVLVIFISCATGCWVRKNWYQSAVDYYTEGIRTNWANEDPSPRLKVSDELKTKSPDRQLGYLLKDLDGDGIDELLIGFNDGSTYTKFTDLIVWHSDYGSYKALSGTNGYYILLCDGNVIRADSWLGSETKMDYMKWNPKTNAFTIVDGEGDKYLPLKWELTPFE